MDYIKSHYVHLNTWILIFISNNWVRNLVLTKLRHNVPIEASMHYSYLTYGCNINVKDFLNPLPISKVYSNLVVWSQNFN